MNVETAKEFIVKNARPVELELYRYFYENGSKDKVIAELVKYQNADGGFGNGLEADNWNPNSNPIATNDAIITLYRINGLSHDERIVQEIVTYLNSHDSFDEEKKCWLFAIDSNMNYPHAIWWEKNGDGISGYNPTVSLATFMVCYGDNKEYYKEIVRDGFSYLSKADEVGGDTLKCFLLSYELLRINHIEDVIDFEEAKHMLSCKIENAICKDLTKYGVVYEPVPSDFFSGVYRHFITGGIQQWIDAEKTILKRLQKEDGGFDITWQWCTNYSEFSQAREWWRPRVTLEKLLYFEQ